jgi:phage gpG-like protein
MIKFTYDLNSEPVEKALAAFQESLVENAGALARIADDFREMVAEQFATEGRAAGTPWAELAPSTARRRRPGSTILYSTGALLRSLGEPGAADHREELEEQSLVLGSRLPYALYHQTGTGRGFGQSRLSPGAGRGMPMRPLIVLTGERAERWVEIVRRQLNEKTLLLGARQLTGKEL